MKWQCYTSCVVHTRWFLEKSRFEKNHIPPDGTRYADQATSLLQSLKVTGSFCPDPFVEVSTKEKLPGFWVAVIVKAT